MRRIVALINVRRMRSDATIPSAHIQLPLSPQIVKIARPLAGENREEKKEFFVF